MAQIQQLKFENTVNMATSIYGLDSYPVGLHYTGVGIFPINYVEESSITDTLVLLIIATPVSMLNTQHAGPPSDAFSFITRETIYNSDTESTLRLVADYSYSATIKIVLNTKPKIAILSSVNFDPTTGYGRRAVDLYNNASEYLADLEIEGNYVVFTDQWPYSLEFICTDPYNTTTPPYLDVTYIGPSERTTHTGQLATWWGWRYANQLPAPGTTIRFYGKPYEYISPVASFIPNIDPALLFRQRKVRGVLINPALQVIRAINYDVGDNDITLIKRARSLYIYDKNYDPDPT